MRLTRRNALIGLGTVAAGAGVIGGSGAFTSVEADRSVSVQTAGDSSAALTLVPEGTNDEYVDDSNNVIEINFDEVKGLNLEAVTTINPLITITNNGTNNVDLGMEITDDNQAGFAQYVELVIDGTETGSNSVAADGTYSLNTANGLNFGLIFDIPESVNTGTFNMTLTITAEAQ